MTLTRFALTPLVVTLFAGAGAVVPTDNTQAQSASARFLDSAFDGVLGPAVSEMAGNTILSIETSGH